MSRLVSHLRNCSRAGADMHTYMHTQFNDIDERRLRAFTRIATENRLCFTPRETTERCDMISMELLPSAQHTISKSRDWAISELACSCSCCCWASSGGNTSFQWPHEPPVGNHCFYNHNDSNNNYISLLLVQSSACHNITENSNMIFS